MDSSHKGQALPFITFDKNKGFSLSKEAEAFLSSLKNEQLGVISIAGKYRTGKSFFVNRVLLNSQQEGFTVGPTVNPCTKGLWLWNQTLQSENPEYPDMKILLIDTEGFAGLDENATHDTRIFIFSLLLSSFFIYNSVGTIDESALNNLSLIINLAKEIQMKSEDSSSDGQEGLVQYFPAFLWVVRDFALKLIDANDNPISSKDYLENALRAQKGISDNVESKNRIRRMFTHFFRDRDCCTMVRPLENEKDLQKLDSISDSEMRSEFVEQMISVRKRIFKKVKPKALNGQSLNGGMFLEITKAYIEAINTGKSPNIENAWTYMCKQETYKALEESISIADQKLNRENKQEAMNEENIKQLKRELKEEIMNNFKKKSLGDNEEIKALNQEIEEKFEERFAKFISANNEKWKDVFSQWIEKNSPIEPKLKTDQYKNFYEFKADLAKAKELFDKEVPQGINKEQFWNEYTQKIVLAGAESINKKTEEHFTMQNSRVTQRLEMTENELNTRRKEHEAERNSLYDKIQTIEKENALFKAQSNSFNEKMNNVQREKEKYEELYKKTKDESKRNEEKLIRESKERISDLEQRLEKSRTENAFKVNDLEKRNALLEQESQFIKRDSAFFKEKMELLIEQKEKLRNSLTEKEQNLEELKRKVNDIEMLRHKEATNLKNEIDKMARDLQNEEGRRKEAVKLQNEWLVEKSHLESQVQFFKSQLEENKRLHDALLLALEQGLTANENDGTSELVETNKNLSAAVDNMEMRCKVLEEKNEKLKRYKRMVQNCQALQCMSCLKLISAHIFLNHISSCSNTQQHNKDKLKIAETALNQNRNTEGIIDPNALQISIHQTIVKEDSDSKPYTEYLIQIVYNETQWSVSRKYKSFCELHQNLNLQFPSLKLPESAFSVLGGFQNTINISGAKRPTVIEERRKALQQYLRDLAKIDIVRNSTHFKSFVELEKIFEKEPVLNQQQSNTSSLNYEEKSNTNGASERKGQMEDLSDDGSYYKYQNKERYFSSNNEQVEKVNENLYGQKFLENFSSLQTPSTLLKNGEVKNKENEIPRTTKNEIEKSNYFEEKYESERVEHIEVVNEPKENQTIKLTLQQRSVNTTRHASFSYHPSNNQGNNKPGYTPPSKLFQPTNNNSSYKVLPSRTRDSGRNSFNPNEVQTSSITPSRYHIARPSFS